MCSDSRGSREISLEVGPHNFMAFDCNKERGVSSPDNCSRVCTEGTLVQANPLSHYWKPKGLKSFNKLDNQKSSHGSIPRDSNPEQEASVPLMRRPSLRLGFVALHWVAVYHGHCHHWVLPCWEYLLRVYFHWSWVN